jgi:hypothetical protein
MNSREMMMIKVHEMQLSICNAQTQTMQMLYQKPGHYKMDGKRI